MLSRIKIVCSPYETFLSSKSTVSSAPERKLPDSILKPSAIGVCSGASSCGSHSPEFRPVAERRQRRNQDHRHGFGRPIISEKTRSGLRAVPGTAISREFTRAIGAPDKERPAKGLSLGRRPTAAVRRVVPQQPLGVEHLAMGPAIGLNSRSYCRADR